MGKKLLAARPIAVISYIWKRLINSPYCAFGPLTPCLLVHIVFQNGLHQTVDGERGVVSLALDQ